MLTSVFAKTLRDQRRGLAGWGIAVVLLVALMSALWPTIRDMDDLAAFVENYPEPLREIFAMEDLTTAAGFMDAELYSVMLPAMFLVFAIGRGARLVAGEEEAGTLEPLLASPLPRTHVLRAKAAGLAVTVLALTAVLLVASVISGWVVGMGIPLREQLAGAASMGVLGLVFGWMALAAGAATGRRSTAVGVTSAVAGLTYLLYVLGQFLDWLEPFRWLSPFHLVLDGGALHSTQIAPHVALAIAGIVVVAAAAPRFDGRDVAAA